MLCPFPRAIFVAENRDQIDAQKIFSNSPWEWQANLLDELGTFYEQENINRNFVSDVNSCSSCLYATFHSKCRIDGPVVHPYLKFPLPKYFVPMIYFSSIHVCVRLRKITRQNTWNCVWNIDFDKSLCNFPDAQVGKALDNKLSAMPKAPKQIIGDKKCKSA